MGYAIENRPASKSGWHTPAEAKRYYGRYSREGITVHWWDLPERAGTHDGTVNYILNKARLGQGSVNYVLSNDKISVLVEPDNVAWASQSGNPTTISIEFDPRLNAEGYRKAGWLIAELERRYGRSLTLYPHKHWVSTQCPGTLDLNRMRAEANKWKAGGNAPAPQPTKGDTVMNPSEENEAYQIVLERPMEHKGSGRTGIKFIRDAKAELAAKRAAVAKYQNELKQHNVALTNDLATLRGQVDELKKRPTQAKLDELQKNMAVCQSGASENLKHIESLEAEIAELEKKQYEPTEPEKFVRRILNGIQHMIPLNKINELFRKIQR